MIKTMLIALGAVLFSGCVVSDGVDAAKYVASQYVIEPLENHRFYSCVDYGQEIGTCPEGMQFFRFDPIRTLGDDVEVCWAYKSVDWNCVCPEGTRTVILDVVKAK